MSNVTTFIVDDFDGTMIEWVKIEDDNGSFVCMAKATYDAQQATQVAPQA